MPSFHRPYHALLLLKDEKSLLNELPLDCSPALVRVVRTTSAVKNLQQLAQDADLALLQVCPDPQPCEEGPALAEHLKQGPNRLEERFSSELKQTEQ